MTTFTDDEMKARLSKTQATTIMDADPTVQAGVLSYELHPCRSFPGDTVPE